MPNYSTEDLIRFIYRETNARETLEIERALEENYLLKEKFDALKDTHKQLDRLLDKPRPQSVLAILAYAKRTAPIEQL